MAWITDPDRLRRAESKLVQASTAKELGISYPRTVLTTRHEEVQELFDHEIVVKPLTVGQYLEEGAVRTVFAEAMAPSDCRLESLEAVPFLVQQRLRAVRHLRVVTVAQQTWAAGLTVSADDPVDWRKVDGNHQSFEHGDRVPSGLGQMPIQVARELGLGYSSQDWIETADGALYLVDVNPSGQWLFLPEPIAGDVSESIADSLLGGS